MFREQCACELIWDSYITLSPVHYSCEACENQSESTKSVYQRVFAPSVCIDVRSAAPRPVGVFDNDLCTMTFNNGQCVAARPSHSTQPIALLRGSARPDLRRLRLHLAARASLSSLVSRPRPSSFVSRLYGRSGFGVGPANPEHPSACDRHASDYMTK